MNQTMNDLALLAIGLGLGLVLAVVVGLCGSMIWSASKQRKQTLDAQQYLTHHLDRNTQAMTLLRSDISAALSKLDAERLYSSSVAIQRSAKSLALQVDQLQKVVFAQPASPAIDFTTAGLGMDAEAEDDARMLAENNRWRQAAQTNPPVYDGMPSRFGVGDNLDGLSEEEKSRRVLEYFEKRRAARAGFPYADVPLASGSISAPPTAGSGAYASLLEEAASRPPAPVIAPDFSGTELEEGIDLVGKGELE